MRRILRRSDGGLWRWVLAVLVLVLYTAFVINASRFYFRRDRTTLASESPPCLASQKVDGKQDVLHDTVGETPAIQIVATPAPINRMCPVARSAYVLMPIGETRMCSGVGTCNETARTCTCPRGITGAGCDVDLRSRLTEVQLGKFERARAEEGAHAARNEVSPPQENRFFDASMIAQLMSVVVPVNPETASNPLAQRHLDQLVASLKKHYHGLAVVQVVMDSTTDSGTSLARAWNRALASLASSDKPREWTLLLSPSVIAVHEETNLELLATLLATTDVDVLGFSTLRPAASLRSGDVLQPRKENAPRSPPAVGDGDKSSNREKNEEVSPSGLLEYVFHTDCWQFHGPDRWVLAHEKPLFGYSRHVGKYATLCDRTSDSFALRTPLRSDLQAHGPLFNESMGVSMLTDFFLRAKRVGATVGTCVECLLKTRIASDDETLFKTNPSTVASSRSVLSYIAWGPTVVLPPALLTSNRLAAAFSEAYQVEMVVGPAYVDHELVQFAHSVSESTLEVPFATLTQQNRLQCTKSGGIYGHSKLGLYSPLCHRYQRQRDFLYLSKLWLDASRFQSTSSRRRYGVSLHHGNLFGALRIGVELLWETDGDFDFVAFDDSHEEMMARWERFCQHVANRAGFEIRVTYPEKPWYVSFLRDKTDFQINVRGVHSEFTRGRPPHIHNVSVFYQGLRVYVNGFQNPWVGVRSDPGHDYRRNYLSQQGWVLNFAKSSIACKVPGHPSCLPPCSDPTWGWDKNFCDERWMNGVTGNDSSHAIRPIGYRAAWLRDPVVHLHR